MLCFRVLRVSFCIYSVILYRSNAKWRQRTGVQAALPHAAAPLARLQSAGQRRLGRWLPAGRRARRQTSLPSATSPSPSPIFLSSNAAEGLDSRLGRRGGAGSARLPGGRRARHGDERRIHATTTRTAPLRRRQAHDGRAALQATRRCAAGLVSPGESALWGIQRAVQRRRRRLLQLPGEGL